MHISYSRVVVNLPACTCDYLPQVVRVYMRPLFRVYMRPPDPAPTFSDFAGTARSGHTVHHADDDDSSVHSDALQLSNLILIEGFKNESDLL